MGLFFRSRTEPSPGAARDGFGADPLSAAVAQRAQGNGARTAAPVTFDSALSVSTVWSCAWLLADLVSTMPVDVFRSVGGIDTPMPTPPILRNPAGENVSIEEWLAAGQLALELRGNNYGRIVAWTSFGLPAQIELVHPDDVRVHRDNSTGRLVYWFGREKLDAAEVWHEKANALPGAATGQGVITAAARSMGVAIATEQFGSDWFADGAHPTHIFQNKGTASPSPSEAKAFKDRVMAATRGTREPLVLGSGWDMERLQVAPGESQFIETQHLSAQHVCRFFRVPPEMVGESSGGSNITYANVEQRMLGFLVTGLGPRLVRRERALSRLLPQPQYVKLNRGGLLAVDLGARYRAYAVAIANKWMTQDEVRELEDRMPLTEAQKAQLLELGSGPALPAAQLSPDGTDAVDPATGLPAITAQTGA